MEKAKDTGSYRTYVCRGPPSTSHSFPPFPFSPLPLFFPLTMLRSAKPSIRRERRVQCRSPMGVVWFSGLRIFTTSSVRVHHVIPPFFPPSPFFFFPFLFPPWRNWSLSLDGERKEDHGIPCSGALHVPPPSPLPFPFSSSSHGVRGSSPLRAHPKRCDGR